MSEQGATFVPALLCPRCADVNAVGYTRTHPKGNGDWCCLRCGYAYPNSDALKHYARPGVDLFVAQDVCPGRAELAEHEEPEPEEVMPT